MTTYHYMIGDYTIICHDCGFEAQIYKYKDADGLDTSLNIECFNCFSKNTTIRCNN